MNTFAKNVLCFAAAASTALAVTAVIAVSTAKSADVSTINVRGSDRDSNTHADATRLGHVDVASEVRD